MEDKFKGGLMSSATDSALLIFWSGVFNFLVIMIVLFAGDPDLHDAIIYWLRN